MENYTANSGFITRGVRAPAFTFLIHNEVSSGSVVNFSSLFSLTSSGKIQNYLLREIGARKVEELGLGT
jgi:hypothetical protein